MSRMLFITWLNGSRARRPIIRGFNRTATARWASAFRRSCPVPCHKGARPIARAERTAPRVTCAIDRLPYTPGGVYTIEIVRIIRNSVPSTYAAVVTDQTTGKTTPVGSISVPAAAGRLLPGDCGHDRNLQRERLAVQKLRGRAADRRRIFAICCTTSPSIAS